MRLRNCSEIKKLNFNIRNVETGSVTATRCCNASVDSVQITELLTAAKYTTNFLQLQT